MVEKNKKKQKQRKKTKNRKKNKQERSKMCKKKIVKFKNKKDFFVLYQVDELTFC